VFFSQTLCVNSILHQLMIFSTSLFSKGVSVHLCFWLCQLLTCYWFKLHNLYVIYFYGLLFNITTTPLRMFWFANQIHVKLNNRIQTSVPCIHRQIEISTLIIQLEVVLAITLVVFFLTLEFLKKRYVLI
jgi:hypothetical protein